MLELRGKAQALKPTVHVGKEGITDEVLAELGRQLKNTKLVKVKLLPSFDEDRRSSGERLAALSSAVLVEVRGRTVVLAKD